MLYPRLDWLALTGFKQEFEQNLIMNQPAFVTFP